MPSYASKPVFDWPIDWAAPVNVAMTYDLREIQIGFGPEVFDPTQSHVAHGFEFTVELQGHDEIEAFEAFIETVGGSLRAFWLPGPQRAFVISAGVNASVFDIAAQDFAARWEEHPAQHIEFTKSGETARHGKVSAVTTVSSEVERVTLTAPLDIAPDSSWRANRLHLVRLVGDGIQAESIGEQRMRFTVRVVELPNLYEDTGDTDEPLYFYHFWGDFNGTELHWRFTSHDSDKVSNGETFVSAPIEHGSITRSMRGENGSVTITALNDPDGPFAGLFPLRIPLILEVKILRASVDDPDTTTTLFAGRVSRVQPRGPARILTCAPWLDAAGQSVPAFLMQPTCNNRLGEPNTCQVDMEPHRITATLSAKAGRTITLTNAALAGLAVNWFSQGYVRAGTGIALEVVMALSSTAAAGNSVDLVLASALSAEVGASVVVEPGCDGRITTCGTKYNNQANHGGVSAPRRNLALQAITVESDAAKK